MKNRSLCLVLMVTLNVELEMHLTKSTVISPIDYYAYNIYFIVLASKFM